MANWQRKLDLKDVWNEAQDGNLKLNELSAVVAKRLKTLRDFNDESIDGEKSDLVEQFEALAEDPHATTDEFDEVMSELYDWADTPLDNNFNGKKVCWVATF